MQSNIKNYKRKYYSMLNSVFLCLDKSLEETTFYTNCISCHKGGRTQVF